tara:strand:- start:924 stop:1580 length:657 start_codon:yes stop_codon:yes gene_type:complete
LSKIILDFDGVLFDSAYEAFSVCQNMLNLYSIKGLRNDVSYTEFRLYRPKVKNADDFIPLYFNEECVIETKEFLKLFFLSRENLMISENYASNYYPKFEFLRQILPMMQKNSNLFFILSTRDTKSINIVLESNGIYMKDNIIGQDSIRKHGNKINALKAYGISNCDLYIDDMRHYVDELNEISDISLMADWGYGLKDPDSVSFQTAVEITRYVYSRGV